MNFDPNNRDGVKKELNESELKHARLVVASRSKDKDDCAHLLKALGLLEK